MDVGEGHRPSRGGVRACPSAPTLLRVPFRPRAGRILRIAQVGNPYGRIDEDGAHGDGERRRGIAFKRFSLPPRAAKRRALACAINASNPRRTSAADGRTTTVTVVVLLSAQRDARRWS